MPASASMGLARPRALMRRSAVIATKSVILEVLVGAEARRTVPGTAAAVVACGVELALVVGGPGIYFARQRAVPNLRLTADL